MLFLLNLEHYILSCILLRSISDTVALLCIKFTTLTAVNNFKKMSKCRVETIHN